MYCGESRSRNSVPAGRPRRLISSRSLRARRRPSLIAKLPSRRGSLMKPFQPTVVRGFSKYTRITTSRSCSWRRGRGAQPARVLERRGRVVDRARAHDREQAVVGAVQHAVDRLARVGDGGERGRVDRQLFEQQLRRDAARGSRRDAKVIGPPDHRHRAGSVSPLSSLIPPLATRRLRTPSASVSSSFTVSAQPMHASVIDTPYSSGLPGTRSWRPGIEVALDHHADDALARPRPAGARCRAPTSICFWYCLDELACEKSTIRRWREARARRAPCTRPRRSPRRSWAPCRRAGSRGSPRCRRS